MASKVQSYAISHTASVLGDSYVSTSQNQVSPQRPTPVITFECPKKFDKIDYVGSRDATRFIPRGMETFDGDGAATTFSLTADIQPVAGEDVLDEMDYPPVVAYDTAAGSQITVESVDFAANEFTAASAPSTGTDNVKAYPILSEGTIQMRALNQFGQVEGMVYPWSTPVHRWHDFDQLKRGTEVNLQGSVRWGRYEKVEVLMDSPRQIVWEEDDYPEGEYVSTFEQDARIHL